MIQIPNLLAYILKVVKEFLEFRTWILFEICYLVLGIFSIIVANVLTIRLLRFIVYIENKSSLLQRAA